MKQENENLGKGPEGNKFSRKDVLNVPWRCITERNLVMTLDEGRIMTWRLPDFSALLIALSASLRTEVRVIFAE
jgi:hypothetical protein